MKAQKRDECKRWPLIEFPEISKAFFAETMYVYGMEKQCEMILDTKTENEMIDVLYKIGFQFNFLFPPLKMRRDKTLLQAVDACFYRQPFSRLSLFVNRNEMKLYITVDYRENNDKERLYDHDWSKWVNKLAEEKKNDGLPFCSDFAKCKKQFKFFGVR